MMRVFLCNFGDFYIAIPMGSVLALALQTEKEAKALLASESNAVNYNPDDRNTYVSLPRLFNMPVEKIQHSIILKSFDNDDDAIKNKTILYIPEVECETEIPDEEIFPIQTTFSDTLFSSLFSGIQFDSRPTDGGDVGNPVLLLNPEKLIQSVQ